VREVDVFVLGGTEGGEGEGGTEEGRATGVPHWPQNLTLGPECCAPHSVQKEARRIVGGREGGVKGIGEKGEIRGSVRRKRIETRILHPTFIISTATTRRI